MKKFLSLFLSLLLIFSLSVPALAEEADYSGDGTDAPPAASGMSTAEAVPTVSGQGAADSDTPSGSAADGSPSDPAAASPGSDQKAPGTPAGQSPAQAAPGDPPASGGDNTPPAAADPGISSVGDNLGELPFGVTEASNGDIIIEEHSYTRTVNILDSSFFDDLPTMRSVLVSIFGEYQPRTQSVSTYYDGQLMESSVEYVSGIAGMDMEWVAGVIVFTVLLYCLMKLLGGMVK